MRTLLLLTNAWLSLSLIASAQDDNPRQPNNPFAAAQSSGLSVQRELGDVARALRGLDQSYSFRGFRGTGSWTAGSAFMDWESRGVPVEERWKVSPPPELDLRGCAAKPSCTMPSCREQSPCRQSGCARCEQPACSTCRHEQPVSQCNHCEARRQRGGGTAGLLDLFCNQECRWEPVTTGELTSETGWGVQFAGGHLYAEGAGSALIETCRPASRFAFSVQLDLPEPTARFTPIVQFGDNWKTSNLCLGQLGSELRFRWKTDVRDAFDSEVHELNLGTLASGPHSLSFRYYPGSLTVEVDGQSNTITGVSGDLDNWEHSRFYLGSPLIERRWSGTLYHVAMGDQVPAFPPVMWNQQTGNQQPSESQVDPTPAVADDANADFPPPPSN